MILLKKFGKLKNMLYICSPYRGVEQLVARRAHNPEVRGSSPLSATNLVLSPKRLAS